MVQEVTGIRPANSYRNAIMAEFEDQKQQARQAEQSRDTWIKQNEEFIGQVAPDYFDNPDKYNFDEIRSAVVKKKSDVASINQENSRLSMLYNQDKLTEEQATEGATMIFNDIVSSGLSASSNVTFGINPQGFLKQIEDMSATGFEGEEYNQLVSGFGQAKAKMLLALKARANQPDEYGNSLMKMAGAKNVDELIASAMAPYDQIEQLLINKDFGLAGYYTRLNTMGGDKELNRVLNASPNLRTAQALASIDRGLATLYITEGGKQEGIFAEIAPELTARVVTGQDTFNEATTRIVESNATNSEKAAGINTVLTNLIETVKSGNATPEQIVNAATSLYSLDDKGHDLFQYVKPEERMRLYAKLFNPEVTKAMIASGSKEALNTYYEAARDRVFAIPELTKAAAALNETNSNWQDFFVVKANPSNGRLELVVKQEGVQPFVPAGMNNPDNFFQEGLVGAVAYTFDKRKAEDAINALNYAFDNIGNIAEGMGADDSMKPAIYNEVLRQLHVDLDQGKKEGFFKWLGNSVKDFFVMDESEGNALNQQIQENVSLNLPDGPEDSYYDSIRAAESGGNDSAKNPGSTATGRYQFLTSTWNDLARRYPQLGLTDRTDGEQQERAIRVFTKENADVLTKEGLSTSNANLYAAHFLGVADAVDVLRGDNADSISEYVSPRVIKANPFLKGMTVGEFKTWASSKAS
jgi:hypothetical protein